MTRLAGQNLTSSKSVAMEALLAFVVTVRCESELHSASWVIKSPRQSGGHRDYDGRRVLHITWSVLAHVIVAGVALGSTLRVCCPMSSSSEAPRRS